jgi:spore germination cell wall hydrolase CwlJ-like protein
MVGKSFAAFGCCVLLYFSTQGEIAHTPTFDASSAVEDQIDPVPPPVVWRTNQNQDRRSVISTRVRKNFSDSRDMVLTLPPAKFISWSHTIKTALGMPRFQHNCLTTAVYFEARSEPLLGQLAVATVILNRVKSSNTSICGVVYKGAAHFNACQFSFACDGKSDMVDDAEAWREALKISKLAVANDSKIYSAVLDNLAAATNYHADYVDPRWSRSLNRLAKIGRHIFYSQGPTVGTVVTRRNYI